MKYIFSIIGHYDYIILDRTHLDTEFFTTLSIKDDDYCEYLKIRRDQIKYPIDNIRIVIYVKPIVENMLERQQERNRPGETRDETYLRDVYDIYEELIYSIYPEHVLIENNFDTSEYSRYFDYLGLYYL